MLPPSSEASRLMFSNFDTTLSSFANVECARFFLIPPLAD